jgi:hypothetical protein
MGESLRWATSDIAPENIRLLLRHLDRVERKHAAYVSEPWQPTR